MIINNNQRLHIWLTSANKFDYLEFSRLCREHGIEPQPEIAFAQAAGMITCAMVKYPLLDAPDAFYQFTKDNAPPPLIQKSVGLGDTIAKITHATGLDKLAEVYTTITGQPCGCSSRQEALNKLLPYNIQEEN